MNRLTFLVVYMKKYCKNTRDFRQKQIDLSLSNHAFMSNLGNSNVFGSTFYESGTH